MSWYLKVAAPGAEAKAQIQKRVETELALPHHSPVSREVVKSHGLAGEFLADANPGKTVIWQSNGHIDSGHGNAELRMEVLHA